MPSASVQKSSLIRFLFILLVSYISVSLDPWLASAAVPSLSFTLQVAQITAHQTVRSSLFIEQREFLDVAFFLSFSLSLSLSLSLALSRPLFFFVFVSISISSFFLFSFCEFLKCFSSILIERSHSVTQSNGLSHMPLTAFSQANW
jgi:hypothetical protein